MTAKKNMVNHTRDTAKSFGRINKMTANQRFSILKSDADKQARIRHKLIIKEYAK